MVAEHRGKKKATADFLKFALKLGEEKYMLENFRQCQTKVRGEEEEEEQQTRQTTHKPVS